MTEVLQRRYAWGRHFIVCMIMGAVAYRVWPGSSAAAPEVRRAASALLWLICARRLVSGSGCLIRAIEVRGLRKRALKRGTPYNEARLELLVSAEHPDVDAILAEQQKLRDELDRSAAERRLILLEAGPDLPNRWRKP